MAKPVSYRRISINSIENDVRAAFRPGMDRITGMITRAGDSGGAINLRPEQRNALVDRVGEEVLRMFVGPDKKNAFGNDGVTALAPFPQVLNNWYVKVVAASVKSHHDMMKRLLPEDVYRWLRTAKAPAREMTSGSRTIMEVINVVRPGFDNEAINDYLRMHDWVDPKGNKLPRRIFRNGFETSDRMERLLDDLISQGKSSLDISRIMEQFMLPGRAALRTTAPYGTDASYLGMRLARTEIAFAANRTAYLSALLNPFVDTADIARSANGDALCPICPEHATIDIGQNRVRDPYPINAVPLCPYHPHCMCRFQANVGQSPAEVAQELRDRMEAGELPPITPADDDLLLQIILGAALYELLRRLGLV